MLKHLLEVEWFPLGLRFPSALFLQPLGRLLLFPRPPLRLLFCLFCLPSCFFLSLPLDSLKLLVLWHLCVRPPHTMRITLVLLVQIRSGPHRRVVLVLGTPCGKHPDEFLLDLVIGDRVVAHVSEDVGEMAVDK